MQRGNYQRKGYARHASQHSAVICAKMVGLWTRVGRKMHRFNRIQQVALICPHWRAQWRNLANTIETSVCCGDVTLCHITLTTCSIYLSP